jgi:Rieske Fe-S protein
MPADQEPRVGPDAPLWQLRLADAAPRPAAAQTSATMRRRRLLLRGFWAGLAVLTAGGLAAAADFLMPRDVPPLHTVTVPARDVPRPGGLPFHHRDGHFWLINLRPGEGLPEQFQGYGRPSESGGLLALYDRCTHLGSVVPWRADFDFGGVTGWFRCPTHGATYTKAGLRIFGPAPRSMDTLPLVEVSPAGVVVDTGKIRLGGPDDAQRTMPAGPFSH